MHIINAIQQYWCKLCFVGGLTVGLMRGRRAGHAAPLPPDDVCEPQAVLLLHPLHDVAHMVVLSFVVFLVLTPFLPQCPASCYCRFSHACTRDALLHRLGSGYLPRVNTLLLVLKAL